jgi:hypothetical protein
MLHELFARVLDLCHAVHCHLVMRQALSCCHAALYTLSALVQLSWHSRGSMHLVPCAHASLMATFTAGNFSEYLQAQVNNAQFYSTTAGRNKFGWYPTACTTNYDYICEVPFTSLRCTAPPPVPPPYPPTNLCKSLPGWPVPMSAASVLCCR